MEDRQAPLDGRRILVIEDEFFIADELARQLSQAGAEVIGPCATLEAARATIEAEEGVDLVLLDLNLGGRFTYEVIDQLQERRVPVVLATGYDCEVVAAPYRDLPRFQKPVTGPHLIRTLTALLHA